MASESKTPLNLYQKMDLAYDLLSKMELTKDLTNSQYKSVPIGQLRAAVRSACAKAGLVHVGPVDFEYDRTVADRTIRYVGRCVFRYVNADNPSETVEFESGGEAMDNGDKGMGKLITNLVKNHYKAAWDLDAQSGEDDVDSYSNEEYYAKVERQRTFEPPKANPNDPFFGKKKIEAKTVPVADSDLKQHLLDLIETIDENSPQGKAAGQVAERISKELRKPMTSWDIDHLRQVCIAGGVKE